MANSEKDDFLENIQKRLFDDAPIKHDPTLEQLFLLRVKELGTNTTAAAKLMEVSFRSLVGMIQGSQKTIDFTTLLRLSNFLQVSHEEVFRLYAKALQTNFGDQMTVDPRKVQFLKTNFDLAVLRKVGFIDSISDYNAIEERIIWFFGLKSLYDYETVNQDIAFSEVSSNLKHPNVRKQWLKIAIDTLATIENPFPYNRQGLITCFSKFRSYSRDVEYGLLYVMRDAFRNGVTILFQERMDTLGLRGATLNVNDKPCIVLTDYRDSYATLWDCLMHELFHVVFDWEDIRENKFHLTVDDEAGLPPDVKDAEADKFARDYLLPAPKLDEIRPIRSHTIVEDFAERNQIHPSMVYYFNARDMNTRSAWALAEMNKQKLTSITKRLGNHWNSPKPIVEFVRSLITNVYGIN